MATKFKIDPITRIEGHLEIEVTVDDVGGKQQVVDARSAGTMFRGFEIILKNRDPRDAGMYTQRICGVCPVSHAMAAVLNLDSAFGVAPPDNGRILRNLVLGANYIQSHVLHFYHLSVLDYIDTTGLLDTSPFTPRYVTPDMITGPTAATLVGHYVQALEARRKAHQAGAIFGAKLPHLGTFVVGGCTEKVSGGKIKDFRDLLDELRAFIDNVYVPDAMLLANQFANYYQLGKGHQNLLSFGVFDLDSNGSNKYFPAGRYTDGQPGTVDPNQIKEYVEYAWFTPASGNKNPAQGVTEPDPDKPGGYTWLKAPRYLDKPHEAGPLARMWVAGHYSNGISAMDRIVARALEAQKLANAMNGWLDELKSGDPSYQQSQIPVTASSMGLTEAPRGALGHWMDIQNSVIDRYQVITPTAWNASPTDDFEVRGPIEAALVGTPVQDIDQPIEVLRVVHTFDPCLACAVHMLRPGEKAARSKVLIRPSVK